MSDHVHVVLLIVVTAVLAGIWGLFAWLAAEAWRNRAQAAEKTLLDNRRKRSAATAKGNRTRAENNRARGITPKSRGGAGRPGVEPEFPWPKPPKGDDHG